MALSKIFVAPKNGQGRVKKKHSKYGKNKFWDLWDPNCTKSVFWKIVGQVSDEKVGRVDRPMVTSQGDLNYTCEPKKAPFHGTKNGKYGSWAKTMIFSKTEMSIPQSNPGKRNIKALLLRPKERFRTTCGVFEKIAKTCFFALPLHVSAGIPV